METYPNATVAYPNIIKDVLDHGVPSAPRGKRIKEILGYSFKLDSYTAPHPLQKSRKLNYRFGVLEGLCNVYGRYPTDLISHFNPNMVAFKNPITDTWDGAYAPRISQPLRAVYEELKRDPDSRRAVLPVFGHIDTMRLGSSLDIACTVSVQLGYGGDGSS